MALTSLQCEIRNEVISEMSDINQCERLIRKAINKRKIECQATKKSLWVVLPSEVRKAYRKKVRMRNGVAKEKPHSTSFSEQAFTDAWTHQHFHSHRTD